MDISKDGDSNAILLAISIIMQGDYSVAELTQRNSKIGLDLQDDGLINNQATYLEDELKRDCLKLDLASIRANLNNYYTGLGLNVTVPNFENYSERLVIPTDIDIERGLIAYYTCDGTANDQTGNGFNATPVNLSLTNDRFGNAQSAYYFPAKGSYLEIPHVFDISQETWSYSLWFRIDNYHADGMGLLETQYSSGAFWDIPFYISYSNKCLKTYNGAMVSSGYNLETGVWYHGVLVINYQSASLYVNGELKSRSPYFSSDKSNGSFDPYDGKYYISEYIKYDQDSEFIGAVDDVRFYDRALSQNEVAELFRQESDVN
jgi:hypothetical protein